MIDDDGASGAGAGRRDGNFVQSLERGLAVIRAFDRDHPRMTVSEVARRAGLTRAAARRLLHTLVALGYARADGKAFALAPRVLELGYAYVSSFGIADVAQVYMEEVSRELAESCSLAVLDGAEIVYVARVPTRRIMSQTLAVGTRLPAFPTSMGQVLLAALPEAELQGLLDRHPLKRLTDKTVTDPAAYAAKIAGVRRDGYALVDEELERGVRSVAVPVRDRRGNTIAAMNVGAHAGRLSRSEMLARVLPVLRGAARQTERAIGHF